MIGSANAEPEVPRSRREAQAILVAKPATDALFVGLTQIPVRALDDAGIDRGLALDTCGNLEIGYHMLTRSYEKARKVERSPWKQVSVAYNLFRDGSVQIDTPYSRKVVEYLMKSPIVEPAATTSALRHEIVAAWAAGLASRTARFSTAPRMSILAESTAIAAWARARE